MSLFRKLVRCFPKALQLAEKLNSEAATEKLIITRGALGATHLDIVSPFITNEHEMLLYIAATAGTARSRKQNAIFSGRALYSYAASHLRKPRSMHSIACKKLALSFDSFLLTEIQHTKTFSQLVKKL